MHTPSLIVLSFGTAALVSTIAAVTDSRNGRIPNWLTLPAAVFGVGLHAAMGGVGSAGISLLGLVLAAAVPAILFKVSQGRAIGGGDVKLFAAIGALFGPTLSLEAQFGAFVLLAVFALTKLAFRGQLLRVLGNAAGLLVNPLLPRKWQRNIQSESMTEMRMGPAIATSVLSTLAIEYFGRALPWLG
jgi:prepilin peptidase CpaA